MEKESNSGARQAITRQKKWFGSLIGTAAVLLCFLLAGWFLVLPGFVEKRLAEELTKLGFDRVEMQVVRIGLNEAKISDLRLGGKDPIVIRYLVAKFSPSQILKGHLEEVTINGMEFKTQVTGSSIHLPQLQNLTLPESNKPNEPIPVNKIQIQSAKVKLQDHNGLNHDVPIEATIRQGRPKTLEVEFSSGESLSAGGRLSLDKGTIRISDGALKLNSLKLPIPGLENPLENISLSLFFEAEKGAKETTLNLRPGSNLSTKLKRFSLANGFESTGIELKLNVIHASKINFADGKFILAESPDFIRGNVKADHVVWIDEDSKITVRELKTTISASSRSLSLALQKGAKSEWLPSEGFLKKQGIKAKNTAVNLDKLLFPAQLQLNRNGSWNASIPQAHFRLSSEAITINESGLTCDAIKAGFNLKTDISNDHLSMKLLSPANVTTGKILHKTFHDAQPLEVSSTEWRLSPVHARPVISKTSNGDPQFMVRISSDKTALKQGGWNLQVEPLSVLLEKTAKTNKLSEWNDTRLVFSPDNEWLRENGVEAQSVKLTIDQIPSIQMPESNQIDKWALIQSNVQVTGEAKSMKLPEKGIEMDYLKIPTQLEIAFDERGLDLDLEKDAIMEVRGARYRSGKKIVRVLSDHWKLGKKSAAPILHLDTADSEFDFNGRLAASEISVMGDDFSLNPLSAIQIPFNIKRDKINFQLNCHSSTTLVATLDGKVSPGQQRYNLSLPPGPNSGKVLRDLIPGLKGVGIPNQLGANLSVSYNQKTGPVWNIRASNILVGSMKLPVIDGEAGFTESADYFSVACELIDGLTAGIKGNRTDKGQSYTLKIPSSPKTVAALRKFFPGAGNLNMPDRLGVDVMVTNSADSSGPWEFGINNLTIGETTFSHLTGEVRLTDDGQQFNAECELIDGLKAKVEGNRTDKNQSYAIRIPFSSETGPALVGLIPALKELGLPDRLGVNIAISNEVETPVLWNFGINDLTIGPNTVPPINGEARLTEDGQQFNAECELIDGLKVKIEGNRTDKIQNYTFKVPSTNISDKSALGNLFHELEGFEIGGTLGLETDIIKSSNTITSTSEILLDNCSISSSKHSAKVEGLSGNIRLNGIGPFSTQDAQHLSLDLVKYGGLELINGAIAFELKPHEILFKEAKWSLKQDEKGVFRATNFSLSENKSIQTVLEVRDLDLGLWLGLLTDGKVLASGKLHGRIPVSLYNKDDKIPVKLGDGAFLKSSKPGKFQFKSAKWASDWLDSVDPRFKSDPTLMELRDSLVEALQDFSYSTIKLDYNEGTDSMRVLIKGEGKTQKGRVVKFDPTINIKPVASWVNEVYTELVLIENLISRDLNGLFDD